MGGVVLKRKAYDRLLECKRGSDGRTAVLINGARRTGKSFLAKRFAEQEYESHILIDFSKASAMIKDAFKNDANHLDVLFNKIMLEYDVTLVRRRSVIIFDEVQMFPRAREMIKALVEDGRYDYIETGSLLSIEACASGILIPSEEEEIMLNPLDFEEFLWAMGAEGSADILRNFLETLTPLGDGAHRRMMTLFREYMLVGGMPQVVCGYASDRDFKRADKTKREILRLYRSDCSKLAGPGGEMVRNAFDGIPGELNGKEKTYRGGTLNPDSDRNRTVEAFMWLLDSRVVNICVNSTDPGPGLSMYTDRSTIKVYMADTGLLITQSISALSLDTNETYRAILADRLGMNEGMFVENAVAQMLTAEGRRLFFYSRSDHNDRRNDIEVDFLIMKDGKVCPVEVKSSKSTKHVSLDKFRERFGKRIGQPYILCTRDIGVRDGIVYLPLYMAAFL